MSQVTLPLPSRSIAITGRPFAMPAAFLFTVVILSAMAVGLAIWQGPGLWRDWQISQNPLTLDEWDMVEGECSSRRGLTDCEADVTYSYQGDSYAKHISLAFLDFSSGDYLVDLVISADDPELATISLGLDMLWNRLAVFAVFMLLFGGGAIAMIWGAIKANRANGAARSSGRLEVVPVHIAGIDEKRADKYVGYHRMENGKRKGSIIRTHFRAGEEPLMAIGADGGWYGVAVQPEHLSMPVMLDRGLTRLDISDAERQHALAVFEAEQERRGVVPGEAAKPKKQGLNWVRGLLAGASVLLLAVVAFFGFWLYYVMAAPDAFDPIGIEINNIMPEPLNTWGCQQLHARFGNDRAPFGCVADDYVSWKVAGEKTKVKS